ncbi:MAG: hypothetical protein ACM3WQ_01675 [Chloroflexota bacterium]
MKTKIVLGILLLLSISITGTIISIVPAPANSNSNEIKYNLNPYGLVVLQVPPGSGAVANHPTDLALNPYHFARNNKLFDYAGYDEMWVAIWIPSTNKHVPVAIITDNLNPEAANFYKKIYAGSPITENIIVVEDVELEVWTETSWTNYGWGRSSGHVANGDALIANLTRSVEIKFGDHFPQFKSFNFTLPPLSLMFRQIGDDYRIEKGEEVTMLNHPPYTSGYSITRYGWSKPAWVATKIPAWFGPYPNFAAGTMSNDWTIAHIPPT